MGWMDMLLGGLGGAATAGVDYETAKRKRQREDEDVRLQRERQARMDALAERQFGLQQQNADEDRAARVAKFVTPDMDLTGMPDVAATLEKGGIPLVRTPSVGPRKLADSLTLPSMPSSDLRLPGSAPMASMPGAKYDPTATEGVGPAPLSMGGPIKVNLPTYDIGTPGKVTRAKTSQEALADKGRTNQISMLRGLLDTPNLKDPAVRTLIEGEIANLESGGQSNMTAASVMSALRLGEPEAPRADKDVIEPKDRSALAAALNTQDVPERWSELTPQQRRVWDTYENPPRATSAQGPTGNLSTRDRVDYQQALSRLQNRPEVRDYQEVGRYVGTLDAAMTEARQGKPASLIAVDQALINSFNKMLDPTSVVREAEYARTAQDQALMNRLRGQLGPDGRLVLGGAGLTMQDREAMARMAKAFVTAAEKKSQEAMQEIADYYDAIETSSGKTVGEMLRESWERSKTRRQAADPLAKAQTALAGKPNGQGVEIDGRRFAVINGTVQEIR